MKILTILFNDQDKFDDSCLEIFSFIKSLDNNLEITSLNFGGDKRYISKLPSDNNFYVVDTQKTLKEHPNWGNSVAEWDDEIHPDDDGFKRIMYEKIGPKIKQLL